MIDGEWLYTYACDWTILTCVTTNRKWHMDYQMVTLTMTSRDPRRCCEAILATAWLLVLYGISNSLLKKLHVVLKSEHCSGVARFWGPLCTPSLVDRAETKRRMPKWTLDRLRCKAQKYVTAIHRHKLVKKLWKRGCWGADRSWVWGGGIPLSTRVGSGAP